MKSSLHTESFRYSYAFNNPLKYTDPSGWWPQGDPGEDLDEPKGWAFTSGGEAVWTVPNWYGGPMNFFAGCGFDSEGRLARASVRASTYRPPEAGKTFEDYYFLGADGKYHRRDWLANEWANAPTYTFTRMPSGPFTKGYSDQEKWDNSLLASNDPEKDGSLSLNQQNKERLFILGGTATVVAVSAGTDLPILAGAAQVVSLGTSAVFVFESYSEYSDNPSEENKVRRNVATTTMYLQTTGLWPVALYISLRDLTGQNNRFYERRANKRKVGHW